MYGMLSSIRLIPDVVNSALALGSLSSDVAWISAMFGFLDAIFDMPAGIFYDAHGICSLTAHHSALYLASFVELTSSGTLSQLIACLIVTGVSADEWNSSGGPVIFLGSFRPVAALCACLNNWHSSLG